MLLIDVTTVFFYMGKVARAKNYFKEMQSEGNKYDGIYLISTLLVILFQFQQHEVHHVPILERFLHLSHFLENDHLESH